VTDGWWIASLCLARVGFALIFGAYSAALGLLKQDWGRSPAQAGRIESAWHVDYPVSLFAIGFLAGRYGAKRTFLATSIAKLPRVLPVRRRLRLVAPAARPGRAAFGRVLHARDNRWLPSASRRCAAAA
jgi:MFS family permease